MARYLFDTNHLSAAIDDEADVREHIRQLRQPGHRLGTCVPILCELETGLERTQRREYNRRILATLLQQIRIWPSNHRSLWSMPGFIMRYEHAGECYPRWI